MCQKLFRVGGETVYVNAKHPNGLLVSAYQALPKAERKRKLWHIMTRDAHAYVRGTVSHPDHKTIWLNPWHEVVMNTETKSRAMRNVAFLD